MATYKIVSVARSGDAPHDHVVSVDTGPTTRVPVEDVRAALDAADTYYVFGGGQPAAVEKLDCECGAKTIRSGPTATAANDLSAVPASS